jgi:hypothetical protein
MKKQTDERFKTHIAEPRWQQIASVVFILVIICVFVALAIFGDKR